jgi:hypothetical protein
MDPNPAWLRVHLLCVSCFVVPVVTVAGVAAVVAGSRGAGAESRLPPLRHWLACSAGVMSGAVVVGLALALLVALALPIWAQPIELLVPFLGIATAYRTARFVAARLNWYTCARCQCRFQSRGLSDYCPACDARLDRAAVAAALDEFDERYRELHPAARMAREEPVKPPTDSRIQASGSSASADIRS